MRKSIRFFPPLALIFYPSILLFIWLYNHMKKENRLSLHLKERRFSSQDAASHLSGSLLQEVAPCLYGYKQVAGLHRA